MKGAAIFLALNLADWADALELFRDSLGKHGFSAEESQAFCLALFSAAANAQTTFNYNVQAK